MSRSFATRSRFPLAIHLVSASLPGAPKTRRPNRRVRPVPPLGFNDGRDNQDHQIKSGR